jgi:LacI family transcriptional regulator
MATMMEVAHRARVSIATVSGVLNGSRNVTPKLRRRVLKAVEDLDYTVNNLARSLHSRSTQLIGMLVPDISDPFHANVVRVVEDVLKTAGYSLLLGNLRDRPEEQTRYLQVLRAHQVDGILIYMVPGCEGEIRKLVAAKKPVVLLGRAPESFEADLVAIDHVTGSRMAVGHLLGRGHHHIGIIPGPGGQPFSRGRVEGWRQALESAGIGTTDSYVRFAEYTIDGGASAASMLLDQDEPPTALLAGNFHLVVGTLRALRQRRISRGQVELMSSHDAEVFDEFTPPISSVEQPSHEMGTRATELLLRQIRQPGCPVQHILLQPRLRIRT